MAQRVGPSPPLGWLASSGECLVMPSCGASHPLDGNTLGMCLAAFGQEHWPFAQHQQQSCSLETVASWPNDYKTRHCIWKVS